jgi:L-rhamnose mutarotase
VERVCFLARVRPERLVGAMGRTEANARWQAEMSGFFVEEGPPDQSFTRLDETFHLDEEMTPDA